MDVWLVCFSFIRVFNKIKESSAFKQGSFYIRMVNPQHLQEYS